MEKIVRGRTKPSNKNEVSSYIKTKSVNNLSIIISSPSCYRDVFDISADLFHKNWNECIFRKIYSTNDLEVETYKGFEVIELNDCLDWISRTLRTLENIQTKFAFILTDDAFLVEEVQNSDIEDLIAYMDINNILYTRMYRNFFLKKSKNLLTKNIYQLYYDQPYSRSLFAGIWNVNHITMILKDYDNNAWKLEEKWLKEGIDKGNEPLKKYIYFHNNYILHGLYKGLWIRKARRKLKFIGILNSSQRKKVSFFKTISIKLKRIVGNLVSARMRAKIKQKVRIFIKMDTKY